uniref:Sulfatase N-terminal domain-containing protein n=2 Tax=Lotharella globosa TaxID=91324 RepID=A0A7S3YP25_9EUKA|mmetsp:Transcript_8492/g.16070  ORF Transcript_8492/g.16070 Transcript_8492/m.16070 type:complete len:260 (+) Transcript_8492:160-939(+)
MPEFYDMYDKDPDYLGALTQMDTQIGRLLQALEARGLADNTVVFFTSDNGPHQGDERTDIAYSTAHSLRQCKGSVFEGGLRVPGIMHWPQGLKGRYRNVTTPVASYDLLPTVMDLLRVKSTNNWTIDGTSLLDIATNPDSNAKRERPLIFNWDQPVANKQFLRQEAVIDNEWKLLKNPQVGQCDQQDGFAFNYTMGSMFLFNLNDDIHETTDLKHSYPAQYQRLMNILHEFHLSINQSQQHEAKCTDLNWFVDLDRWMG